jgi:acyl-CoA synthetase (AMP-forming)/AMP-acid ligase II
VNTSNFVGIPAQMFPDEEILVYGDRRFTYGQLWREIQRLAAALGRAGIRRGDRVGALHTNSDLYVIAYYATAAAGAVFVPLNYRAKPPELEHMIGTASIKLLFVGDRYAPVVETLKPRLPSVETCVDLDGSRAGMLPFEELRAMGEGGFEEIEVDDDDVTILMYTSGTTSLPKGVMLTYNDFTAYVCGNVELADGTPRGTALLAAPLYHIAGATNIMTALFTGRRLVVLEQFEPRRWLEAVERERVTHAFVVPTMMKHLIDHPDFARFDLSSLQNLSYGGAAMPFPVIRRAIEMFPKSVGFVNAFGQTETTSTLTILGPDDHRLDGPPAEVERNLKRLVSIGRPLPDVAVKVVDETGRDLAHGEVGELWVKTDRTMKGYADKSGGVSSPEHDGWLPTRDMGWIDPDGYIYLAGRKDDMIIRGGENISPAEVEATLYAHPGVEEVAVIGVPDEEWGQRVAAFVVARPGSQLNEGVLAEFCRARLASFKKPEIFRFVAELPKNPMGKILKKDLREEFAL